jgi:hypothetical protein
MRNLLLVVLTLVTFTTFAQSQNSSVKRDGFVFGAGVGGGIISLSHSDAEGEFDEAQGAFSLPNLKIGWMLNDNLALLATFPGMLYEVDGKDRSFEAVMPTLQYWVSDKWWVNGGVGLGMDLPAFYNVKNVEDETWNFGCAVAASAGYEFVQRENFAIDFNAKVHLGRTFLENDAHLDGIGLSVGVGFTWF